ncbi:uncharacterized protein J4E78_003479 [Alternaria triticimaculans]|uniref:uncharacterized protein n=1 Tax=Alternaria triticimaculans TaxID=297637 RepID=UPI0020C53FDD|nr:uncharacterized protein J4E78_003479 [Alternaria triticimaculans]XP_049244856.1 uncharacterized protein J4E84_004480 [Alternaria hordeiaustralica]KAI4666014.1 hypothetical protein J4E78_003479 [Alternaria triticimaculans]KAI4688550.1 hypothetical protein J4E84_004480 [Alternaria hordeiaustralica]
MSGAKHIIFDIVGTLVSHEHFYAVIDQRLGPKLQANNISARLLEPRSTATEEDVKYFIQEYTKCEVRPGAKECVDIMKKAGWTVWAFTSGDRPRVMGYFERGNIDIDNEHIVTCDDVGVGKPDLKAYEKLIGKIGVDSKAGDLWFAAAHGWDVSAAGRAGFKTAYCLVLEKEALDDVFGKMDVVAATLPELAEKVTSL